MATQSDNDKGKGIERPSTPNRQYGDKRYGNLKLRPDYLRRRFHEGKWYCDCENGTVLAKCLSSRKIHTDNYKKPFWVCPRVVDQCDFFVWAHEAETEKRKLAEYEPFKIPSTPRSRETPWTIARENSRKRKARQNGEVLEEDDDDSEHEGDEAGPSTQRRRRDATPEREDQASPSRRVAARSHRFSTPSAAQRLSNDIAASSLPSPQSSNPNAGDTSASRLQTSIGSRLESAIVLDDEKPLTLSIIKLLKDDGVAIKGSTKIMINSEVELVVDVHATEVRRYRETIATLKKSVDELEKKVEEKERTIGLLTGFGSSNESDGEYD